MRIKHFVMLAATIAAAACNQEMKQQPKYIGPSDPEVRDGIFSPEVLLSLGRLSDPQLSPDGKTILYGVSYNSLEENRSCRNIYACAADGSGKVQLTREGRSVSNARWSPDGKAVFFLQGGQLYKASFNGNKLGKKLKLSDVPKGIDEFELSPDGSRVMYVSSVHSHVEVPSDSDPALDKARAYATEDLMYRHWDHWVTDINHTFIAPLDAVVTPATSTDILGGPDVLFQLPNGPFGGIGELSWSPDGRYVAYSCKKLTGKEYAFSTNTEIYIFDTESGKTFQVTGRKGYDTAPSWSPDGTLLAWLSMERDGYEADKVDILLSRVTFADGVPSCSAPENLTAGFKYNADGFTWAPDGKNVVFNSLAEGLQGIFKVAVPEAAPTCPVGEYPVERLTADDLWFDFGTPFGFMEDGTMLTTYCSMDFPTEMVAVSPGGISQIGDENGRILSALKGHETRKRMVRTVDGKDMLTWVLLPPDFDSTKVYPAIEICLGGPQGTLSQGWSYRWNYRLMCSQGYVVVLPNRRGTTAFGQEWCEQISGDYIGLNMQDYLSAARMIKAEPYVGKLAACGASYGGYSVYYLAGIHGDTYDCFIAHAGIFNEEHMYMTTEEMWFPNWDNGGIPVEYAYQPGKTGPDGDGITFGGMQQAGSPWSAKPEARRHYANSPHTLVKNWHTPILCIHGGSDFRVPYDEGMAAFNAAQMMGVPSKLIVFPDENHWILQPQNALYWHRSYFGWLDRWTKQ